MINKRFGIENSGYRVIALMITLILWVTVVSQKETIINRTVTIEFMAPPQFMIRGPSKFDVTVRLEGHRFRLNRFLETHWIQKFVIPITNPVVGHRVETLSAEELGVPSEIKVLSMTPKEVVMLLEKKE